MGKIRMQAQLSIQDPVTIQAQLSIQAPVTIRAQLSLQAPVTIQAQPSVDVVHRGQVRSTPRAGASSWPRPTKGGERQLGTSFCTHNNSAK